MDLSHPYGPALLVAAVFAVIIPVAGLGDFVFGGFDAGRDVSLWTVIKFVLGSFVILVVFVLKSVVNVVLLGIAASWTLYKLLMYGELEFVPIVPLLFEACAPAWPASARTIYSFACYGLALASATKMTLQVQSPPGDSPAPDSHLDPL